MNINMRLDDDVADMLTKYSLKHRKTKVSIVNDAIRAFVQNESFKEQMLETISKNPEAIAQVLKVLNFKK